MWKLNQEENISVLYRQESFISNYHTMSPSIAVTSIVQCSQNCDRPLAAIVGTNSSFLFPPFLEETHALAPTVRTPQVASTGAVVAAVFRSVIAVTTSSDACASEKVN